MIRILTLVTLVTVTISTPSSAPLTGEPWLEATLVSAADLPGYTPIENEAVPLTDIIGGEGGQYDDIRAGSLVAGFVRRFAEFGGDTGVGVRLVEHVNHGFAAAKPLPAGEVPVAWSDVPDVVVARNIGAQGTGEFYARFVKGRVQAEVLVNSYRTNVSPQEAMEALRFVVGKQYEKLPWSADLSDRTTISLKQEQVHLYLLGLLALLVVQASIWFVVSLADRGTREGVIRRVRGADSILDPRVGRQNIGPELLRRRRRYRVGVAGRTIVLIGAYTATYSWTTTVGQLVVLGCCAVAVAIAQALLARRSGGGLRQRAGWWPIAVAVVGGALSLGFAAVGLLLLWIRVVAISTKPDLGISAEELDRNLRSFLVLGLLSLALSDLPHRLGRRLTARNLKGTLAQDNRPEILLLRAFADDGVRLRVRRTSRQPLLERLSFRRRERFEEVVAWSLWKFGPPVTLAEPGTVLPPLGAVRQYADDNTWENAVTKLIRQSGLVVVIVGRSPSLLKEIGLIRAQGRLSDCLLILPPVSGAELRERLVVLASALDVDPGCLPPQNMAQYALLTLTFDDDGMLVLGTSSARDDIAYQVAIEAAAVAKMKRVPAAVSDPEPAVYRPGEDDRGRLRTSPSRAEARRAKWARKGDVGQWAVQSGLCVVLFVFWVTGPAVPPVVTPPGDVVIKESVASLAVTASGRVAGLDPAGRLVGDVRQGMAATAVRLPHPAAILYSGGNSVYAAAESADRVMAVLLDDRGPVVAWDQPVGGFPSGITESGGRVFVSVPEKNIVAVLDAHDGHPITILAVPGGPSRSVAADGKVLVGQVTAQAITTIDASTLRVMNTTALGVAPSEITVVGDEAYITSVEESELMEYSLAEGRVVHQLRVAGLSGNLAVGGLKILAASFSSGPRLVSVDRRDFTVTSVAVVPSELYSVVATADAFYCSFTENAVVTRVPRA